MKPKHYFLLSLISFLFTFFSTQAQSDMSAAYTAVITGFDWGQAVNKVVLNSSIHSESLPAEDFQVLVSRSSDTAPIPPQFQSGERSVLRAFPSDEKGTYKEEGEHITLLLAVAPTNPLGSPIQYYRGETSGGNIWIDYKMTIVHVPTQSIWNTENSRIIPVIDEFDTSGTYEHTDGIVLTYALYLPQTNQGKTPLIIWLHGGGEGGTDPTIPLIANKAYNYASPEIQRYFNGAAVLVPQTPTRWRHGVTSS